MDNICATCGLLGKHMGQGNEVYPILEVVQEERDTKQLRQYQTYDQKIRLRAFSICFGGIDLDNANEIHMANGDYDKAFASIIYRDRGEQGCPKWVPYRPHLNPQWHLEDFKMQQLEQDRREFERKLTKMQIDSNAKVSQVGIWIGIGALILAVAEILTMNKDALLWQWITRIIALIRG